MSTLFMIVAMAALIGSAVIGGVFFAFSSFVMKALARVRAPEGIAAMQSINVAVINPSFLGTFFGTAILSVVVAVMAVWFGQAAMIYFLLGAACYVFGTFFVTMFGNVPLNNELETASPTESEAIKLWKRYLSRWTMWNHVRTVAAISAAVLFTVGLIQN